MLHMITTADLLVSYHNFYTLTPDLILTWVAVLQEWEGLNYSDIPTILKPAAPLAPSWSNKDNDKGEQTWIIIVTVVENLLDQHNL